MKHREKRERSSNESSKWNLNYVKTEKSYRSLSRTYQQKKKCYQQILILKGKEKFLKPNLSHHEFGVLLGAHLQACPAPVNA